MDKGECEMKVKDKVRQLLKESKIKNNPNKDIKRK